MTAAHLASTLRRMATVADDDGRESNEGPGGGPLRLLSRGGVRVAELDLSAAELAAGALFKDAPSGYGLRFLRHGSNPGARLEVSFGGNRASTFFAPGQVIRGGFDSVEFKRAANSARVGKATFAVLNQPEVDLSEDLIISALGPVDLLGSYSINSAGTDAFTFVTIAEDTDPNAAYGTQVGAFDGSGWEMLRVLIDGQSAAANFTTADLVAWFNPSWTGSTWFECGYDGRYSIPDSDTSGARYRALNIPWAGRGVGCFSVRNLLAAARTGLGLIVQGIR